MLKRLAILGIFGLAFVANTQIPRNGSQQQQQTKEKGETTQAPAQLSVRALKTENQAAENTNDTKHEPYKWRDLYAPANIPNWVLCLVGGLAGFLAWRTLDAIRRQADLMKTQADQMGAQTTILGDSVAVARDSAKAANDQIRMMKNKERARVSVEVRPFTNVEFRSGNRVMLKIRNFGYTHALNVKASGAARALIFSHPPAFAGIPKIPWGQTYKEPTFDPLPFDFEDLAIADVLLANEPSTETWASLIFPEEWEDEILMRPRIAIELRGQVGYEDVFGEPHSTKFSYDMRFSKWGEVTPSGSANINPVSRWFKPRGNGGNEAT